MNPRLDPEIDKVIVCTDTARSHTDYAVDFVSQYIQKYGLQIAKRIEFKDEVLKRLHSKQSTNNEIEFNFSWDQLNEPIDLQTLQKFSAGNPDLNDRISKKVSGEDLKNILWQEYLKRYEMSDSLHSMVIYRNMALDTANKFPRHHIFIVLGNHRMTSPSVTSEQDQLDYHYVGRGFYGFGAASPIITSNSRNHPYVIVLPIHLASQRSPEHRKAFIRQYIHHEWEGHALYGLEDQFDLPSDQCIMAVEPSIDQTIANASANPEPYYCDICKQSIRD